MSAPSHAARVGRLELHGDEATLHFERRFRHPIEDVWDAITSPEHLSRWSMTQATIEPRLGGRIEFWSGPIRLHVTGTILAWDPPRLFEHERNVEPRPNVSEGERSVVRWELSPDGEGTLLRFTHGRVTRRLAAGITPATHALLDRLEAQLDGAELPDVRARMGELFPLYRS